MFFPLSVIKRTRESRRLVTLYLHSPNYKIIIFIRKLLLAYASKDFPKDSRLFGIHIEGRFFPVNLSIFLCFWTNIATRNSSANSNTMLEKNSVFLAGAAAPIPPALCTVLIVVLCYFTLHEDFFPVLRRFTSRDVTILTCPIISTCYAILKAEKNGETTLQHHNFQQLFRPTISNNLAALRH